MTKRVNVNFSAQAYWTLQQLVDRHGTTMSEVLRDCIALKVWFDTERSNGARILVENHAGQIREVISV